MSKEKVRKNAKYAKILKYVAGKEALAAFQHRAYCVRDLKVAFACTGCNKCGRFRDRIKTESVAEYCRRKGISIDGQKEVKAVQGTPE